MFLKILALLKQNERSLYTIMMFPLLICISQGLSAQNISFNNSVPSDLTVCEESETFTIEFTNISAGALEDLIINVEMPVGINYLPGSLNESSSLNLQEHNITDLSNIYFSSNDLANNQTLSFTFEASADFVAYNSQNEGNVFNNIVTIEYGGLTETETSIPYNILFGALSITNVSPLSATAFVGGSYTRSVTIVNGGYGSISSFTLEDVHDSALSTVSSTNLGVLSDDGTQIVFNSDDFVNVGNGDGFFDRNESIIIEEVIEVIGCSNFQSTLSAFWGCTGETTYSNEKNPYTTVVLYAPDLVIEATPSFNSCLQGTADNQQLTVTNNGTGPANELEIEIEPRTNNQYTSVDVSSITTTLNGVTESITPSLTDPAQNYSCFGANPKDGFTVVIPPLQPGDVLYLNWDTYTCTGAVCGTHNLVGWEYEATYTDMCNSKSYRDVDDGQERYRKNFQAFFEYPTSLQDQEEGIYNLLINTAILEMPEVDGSFIEVEYDIPIGLVWNGTASDLDLKYMSGTTEWMPSNIAYNSNDRKLTAQYELPIPDDFSLVNSNFELILMADCTQGGGDAVVNASVNYVIDNNCDPISKLTLVCPETGITKLFCPGNCEHGLAFQSFSVQRTSFGQSDNDSNGLPDSENNLDYTKVKTNRVMVGDTLETIFGGTIHTSTTYPSWSYGYASTDMPYGNEIEAISASVIITDASTGQVFTCDQVSISQNISGTIRTVNFDYSPATLVENGCNDFSGFVLEDEDEIVLSAKYKVIENPGAIIEQLILENDFYVSDTPSGDAFQCHDWNGSFTLVGYFFEVNSADNVNVTTCSRTINQNFKMSIGTCCNNFGGGDLFPYEYRNWAHIKTLAVDIPDGYSFVSGRIRQWRTISASNTQVENHNNIEPESINGNTLYFNLENYYAMNGGNLNLSDDGFHGKVFITLTPDCTVDENEPSYVDWSYTFQENDFLGGTETGVYSIDPDKLNFYRADLDISTTTQTQQVSGSMASWNIVVKGKNANAENGWLYLDYLTSEMEILEVIDVSTGTAIPSVNGFYHIGDINSNQTKTYTLNINYNSCSLSELKVISGNDCAGYPTSLETYPCSFKELMLYIEPQPTELQVRFNTELLGAVDCSDSLSIEFEMLSAKMSTVQNLVVSITQPNSQTIEILQGSVSVLYPESGTYSGIGDPSLNGGTYTITGAEMDPVLGTEGLVGITDISANIVKLKFSLLLTPDFQPGDMLSVQITGDEPCGNPLPILSLAVDPSATFGKLNSIGLDELADDWAMAWGDYDNDGFVDLFVADYSIDQPNRLYHNEGNGTFSLVTTGAIATDLAKSLGATWGDYDNDGDIDLFVGNNIGSKNFLYRNDGDGTFTKVINDPLVNYDGYTHGVAWGDYDNDGFLDVFITDYFSTRFNHLYHNNGDGTFTDANTTLPALENASSLSGVWGDYDNDGKLDLFVANISNENNSLYKNTGNGGFVKITSGAIVNDGGNSVGASWGDYNNDGYLDLFVSNAGDQDNFLYANNGDGTFTKITSGDIVNNGGHSHGSAWGDYDNDGDLDLFVSNDADSNNFFYSNNGDGTFTPLDNGITQGTKCSFGAAWADFDNDMDIDLFVANRDMDENGLYLNNRGKCQSKACITLVGSNSNKSAVGAKVRVKANVYGNSIWQMREVSAQSGGGIGGQNEFKLIIGLGDASQIDSMIVEWPSGYVQILEDYQINECNTVLENEGGEICGIAYYDENNNCVQDSSEMGIQNLNIIIQPGDISVTTDETGAYSTFVAPGEYTISQGPSDLWEQDCTISHTVDVVEMGESYCGNNFANFATNPAPDLEITITTTPHRIGFENLIALTYCNIGTEAATGVIISLDIGETVDGDPLLTLLESTVPWASYDGTTATWEIGDVEVGECATIFIKNFIPNTIEVGTLIDLSASIGSNETEITLSNNNDEDAEPSVGGFDPNDIAVTPEGDITVDQELIYTIRFQNVGNAPVSTVIVTDELPEGLDVESLQMGVASHPYRLEVFEESNALVWHFENINMPDSTSNEAASHGYIIYKIRPKADLEIGTELLNKASIFFDNNEPIITNEVINIIKEEIGSDEEEQGHEESDNEIEDESLVEVLKVSPNPVVNRSKVEIVDQSGNLVKITGVIIHSISGAEVYDGQNLMLEVFDIEKRNLLPGCYSIRVIGENKKEYISKLIIH